MKTVHLKHFYTTALLFLTLMLGMSGWGQTTIFSENMGTGATGDPTATVYTGFSNYGTLIFTGTSDIRNNTISDSYIGASGNNNALLTTSKIFEISIQPAIQTLYYLLE